MNPVTCFPGTLLLALNAVMRDAEARSEEQEVFADENARPNRTAAQKRPAPGQKTSRIPNVKARFAHSSN